MTDFEHGYTWTDPYFSTARGQSAYHWFGDSIVKILFDSASTGGRLTVVESRAPQPYASPVHVHDAEDEAFIVLDGTLRAWVGDRRQDLEPGDVGLLPRGLPHAFRIMSPTAHFLVLGLPGGLEKLYGAAGADTRMPLHDGWTVPLDILAASEAARGNRVLGPPPAADLERLSQP